MTIVKNVHINPVTLETIRAMAEEEGKSTELKIREILDLYASCAGHYNLSAGTLQMSGDSTFNIMPDEPDVPDKRDDGHDAYA